MPRLINVHTLQMQEFFDEEIPEYAILSHTWSNNEITLQDWQTLLEFTELQEVLVSEDPKPSLFAVNSYAGQQRRKVNAIKAKAGYQKVLKFCSIVETYHVKAPSINPIDWAWVDTCCIDKTSSAELSEAINSMYRWYQKSTVCMVYLSDVSARNANEQEAFEKEFLKSRWWTRGWTLQELLAPSRIVFLDAEWNWFGTDRSLEGWVERASGIPAEHLGPRGGEDKPDVSISTRMSWAAKRLTTRAEDMAYCLLGIFGVNMPLLYGEGGPRAFARLQEEIMKQSTDHTIFAWGYGMALVGEGIDDTGAKWATSLRESRFDSLLAPSPAYFVNGHLIRRISLSRELPFQMTNRGLQIPLALRKVEDITGTYIALLNCEPVSPPRCLHRPFVGIYLSTSWTEGGKIQDGAVFWKSSTSKPTVVDVRDSGMYITHTVIIQRSSSSLNRTGPLPIFDIDIRSLTTFQPSNPWKLQQVLPQLRALTPLTPQTRNPGFNRLCLHVGLDSLFSFHQARSGQGEERGTMVLIASFTGPIRFVLRVKAESTNGHQRHHGWSGFWNWRVSRKPLDSPGYRNVWTPIPLKQCTACSNSKPAEPDNGDELGGLPYRALLHRPGSCPERGAAIMGYAISIVVSESATMEGAKGEEYNAELPDTPHDVALLQGDEKLYRPEDFELS